MKKVLVAKALNRIAGSLLAGTFRGDAGVGAESPASSVYDGTKARLDEAEKQGKKYILWKKEGNLWRIMACKNSSTCFKGSIGGLVESEKNLSQKGDCWVDHEAKVYENARIEGNARVFGKAEVHGNARVYDKAEVFFKAQVYGNANIYGRAMVYGNAKVYDNALVYDNAKVYGDALVYGDAKVFDRAAVFDHAKVFGNATIFCNAKVCRYAEVDRKAISLVTE